MDDNRRIYDCEECGARVGELWTELHKQDHQIRNLYLETLQMHAGIILEKINGSMVMLGLGDDKPDDPSDPDDYYQPNTQANIQPNLETENRTLRLNDDSTAWLLPSWWEQVAETVNALKESYDADVEEVKLGMVMDPYGGLYITSEKYPRDTWVREAVKRAMRNQ